MYFPRGGSAHVARSMAHELPAHGWDITIVSGVFDKKKLLFYVANRAHHSDVGGMSPGSMPLAEEIYQEGLRIPPIKLMSSGKINRDVFEGVAGAIYRTMARDASLTKFFDSIGAALYGGQPPRGNRATHRPIDAARVCSRQ